MREPVPFTVPDWLIPWWDIWVPFTGALYWPAWAAIFTFAALLNTARIADRQNRETRRKEAVFLMSVRHLLHAFWFEIRDFKARAAEFAINGENLRISKGAPPNSINWSEEFVKLIESCWEDDKTLTSIQEVKLSDFPSVDTFVTFNTARISCEIIKLDLEDFAEKAEKAEEIEEESNDLRRLMDRLQDSARRLHPFVTDPESSPPHQDFRSRTATPGWLANKWKDLRASGRLDRSGPA